MEARDTGLILRVHPLTETSLIVHWLGREHGRIGTVAKGARRPKSNFHGKLDLYFLGAFSFARSRSSDLHPLREVQLIDPHEPLRHDIGWLQQAAYAAALIEQTTETDTPIPDIFALCLDFLRHLSTQEKTPRTVFAFELKLLTLLGWQPDWAQEHLKPGTRALLERLSVQDWPEISRLQFSEAQTAEANSFLNRFIAHHCERVPKKRAAAVEGQ